MRRKSLIYSVIKENQNAEKQKIHNDRRCNNSIIMMPYIMIIISALMTITMKENMTKSMIRSARITISMSKQYDLVHEK